LARAAGSSFNKLSGLVFQRAWRKRPPAWKMVNAAFPPVPIQNILAKTLRIWQETPDQTSIYNAFPAYLLSRFLSDAR
jgi:hypothetical protein